MACVGPIVPGEMGHPFAGQTLAVRLRPGSPAPRSNDIGFTGPEGAQIGVVFGPPPPQAFTNPVIFSDYGVRQALPTSAFLPCSGSGTVPFFPLPPVGGSHEALVPVVYVGQP